MRRFSYLEQPVFDVDGCTQYVMDYDDLSNFFNIVMSESFFDNIGLLLSNYSDFITNIRAYPFDLNKLYNNIANREYLNDIPVGHLVETNIKGWKYYDKQMPFINVASINIPRTNNNFLDLSPYTSYELYLPFFGFTTLEINDYNLFDEIIWVRYVIDTFTGNALILIGYDLDNSGNFNVIKQCECEIGFDIPLGSTNFNDMMKNFIFNGLTSLITLNPVNLIDTVRGLHHTGESKGKISDNRNMLYLDNCVNLIIKSPVIRNVTNYNHYEGKPLKENIKLNDISGYTEVNKVYINNLGMATLTEIDEIESLLQTGVIF